MSRPKGLGTESRADLFYLWAIVAAFAVCGLVALNIAFTSVAKAEIVNHDAKVDLPAGKSYHRICELTEADNIEIINRRSPEATVLRYEGAQARLYTFILQTGNRIDGSSGKLKVRRIGNSWTLTAGFAGYGIKFPVPDRLYIVRQPNRQTVHPFFIVDGCVERFLFQFPHILHQSIVKHMKAYPA